MRSVTGVLPMALAAVQQGVRRLFVPAENAAEAAAAGALCVYPVHTALDAVRHLTGEAPIEPAQPRPLHPAGPGTYRTLQMSGASWRPGAPWRSPPPAATIFY